MTAPDAAGDARSGLRSPAAFATLIVIALLAGAWSAVNSPLFDVDRVVVRGSRRLDASHVRALAGVPQNANLVRLSLDEVAARVERDPWVADAAATRDLPSTLVISIAERRPGGWLNQGGSAVVVAGDGTVLERLDSPPQDLPALGEAPAGIGTGDRLDEPPPALRLAASMPSALLSATRLVDVSADEAVARLRGGGEVRYGTVDRLADKHRAVRSILEWAARQGLPIGVVDVRVPSAPTLRPRGGGAEIAPPVTPAPTPTGTL